MKKMNLMSVGLGLILSCSVMTSHGGGGFGGGFAGGMVGGTMGGLIGNAMTSGSREKTVIVQEPQGERRYVEREEYNDGSRRGRKRKREDDRVRKLEEDNEELRRRNERLEDKMDDILQEMKKQKRN